MITLQYDVDSKELVLDGNAIVLRAKEKELLDALISATPEYVTREELCNRVWKGRYVSDFTINQTVNSLRKKLGDAEKTIILTVPRKGYAIGKQVEIIPHLLSGNDSQPEKSSTVREYKTIWKQKNYVLEAKPSYSLYRKYFRRSVLLIALFFCALSIGVGIATLLDMSKQGKTTVYIDGKKFDIYRDRVEYLMGRNKVICKLAEGTSREGDYIITGKTTCHTDG
ncbi:winged helix-turn-helix domain-containing protein [Enterobacter sp. ASE]|uniref:winged helix-turn-helix domain-containing protein n=1 Tax=Enterobacter sp. ASE TaxID=2905968 RepID=UPI001E4024C8|nr:winged helix-turn-helix domain-containing protein [Enterobacter sp. ASE]MCE3116622.1 winged helix-turn-helix domain-containing protein [Enterobacter sp. ASE]